MLWILTLKWRHNERDGVSNYHPYDFYSAVYSGEDQRRHQSSVSLAFVRGIHRWPANSPHKGPVTWKMYPFDDVIVMYSQVARSVLYIETGEEKERAWVKQLGIRTLLIIQFFYWFDYIMIVNDCNDNTGNVDGYNVDMNSNAIVMTTVTMTITIASIVGFVISLSLLRLSSLSWISLSYAHMILYAYAYLLR